MTQEQKTEIMRLRAIGKSYSDISGILELSVNTVKAYCQRHNLGGRLPTKNADNAHTIGSQTCIRIGATIVAVNAIFNPCATETIEKKIERLLLMRMESETYLASSRE